MRWSFTTIFFSQSGWLERKIHGQGSALSTFVIAVFAWHQCHLGDWGDRDGGPDLQHLRWPVGTVAVAPDHGHWRLARHIRSVFPGDVVAAGAIQLLFGCSSVAFDRGAAATGQSTGGSSQAIAPSPGEYVDVVGGGAGGGFRPTN